MRHRVGRADQPVRCVVHHHQPPGSAPAGPAASPFGIRIDTWWKFWLVLALQTTRSIQGSLLLNIFWPHLMVNVQAADTSRKAIAYGDTVLVIVAQACWNIFGFVYTGLSDTFLMLSQIDLSVVTLVVTMLADAQCTAYAGEGERAREATAKKDTTQDTHAWDCSTPTPAGCSTPNGTRRGC